MANYNIKEIENLSGIRAHTLRIWERRYGIIEPKRTDTNIRYYDDKDLRKILNISILNRSGFKISKIANLPDERLNEEVLNITGSDSTYQNQIGTLIKAMIDFDELLFEKTYTSSVIHLGFDATVNHIIYPFFQKIGILWLTGNVDPAQEHFVSILVRQKIISAIDSIPNYYNSLSKSFVVFMQHNQWHELSLLISSYLIKRHGHRPIYIGKSLPLDSLINMLNIVDSDFILTTVNYNLSINDIQSNITELASMFVDKTIIFGGVSPESIPENKPANTFFPQTLVEFDEFLQSISDQRNS